MFLYIYKLKRCLIKDSVLKSRKNLFVRVLVFALLVSNAARSLASGLARSLALAAAAVLCGLSDVSCSDSLDSAHFGIPPNVFLYERIISQ